MLNWSSDGRHLLFSRSQRTAGSVDIWALPLFGDHKPFPIVESPFTDTGAVFSPDGKWIAYASAEAGSTQIFVRPFPTTGGQFQISRNGGFQPLWRRDGKELFFISPDEKMMAASIDTAAGFQSGDPTPLFPVTVFSSTSSSSNQRRFL